MLECLYIYTGTDIIVLHYTYMYLYAGIDDLAKVLHYLDDYPYVNWFRLGLDLGLGYNTLRAIKVDNHQQADNCFMEMLATWLRSSDQVLDKGGPTWKQLIEALEKGGNKDIASKIKRDLRKRMTDGQDVPRQKRPLGHSH